MVTVIEHVPLDKKFKSPVFISIVQMLVVALVQESEPEPADAVAVKVGSESVTKYELAGCELASIDIVLEAKAIVIPVETEDIEL
jgi:hypothetical protein